MYIVNENEREYRFGDSGPKYLMKGPRMNFALVAFNPGQDFKAHYHNVMEENFYILEGEIDIVVDGVVNHLKAGDMIHIEPGEIHYCKNSYDKPMKMSPPSRRTPIRTRWTWRTTPIKPVKPDLSQLPSHKRGGSFLLCKSFHTVSFSGAELHDLQNFVGDAAGSMPVW